MSSDKLNNIIVSNDVLIKKLYDYLDVVSEFINNGKFDLGIELIRYNQDVETEYKKYLQTYRDSIFTLIDNGIEEGLFKSNLDRDMIFHYIDMGIIYYQQSPEYRYKLLNDSIFKKRLLLFHISNIFINGEKMMSISDEVF